MKKVVVFGATGKMGTLICKLAESSEAWHLTDKADIAKGDVLIDFTLAEATLEIVGLACQHKKPIVIGTTGLNQQQQNAITEAARTIPIVYSPNMSVGMNVLFKLVAEAAKAMGPDYAIEISETHHSDKKDKPSGTAKKIGEIVEEVTHQKPSIQSIREGEVIGDHTIIFGSEAEHLAIMHRALDRKVFAEGALKAAQWVIGKSPGLYSMAQVLGLA